MRVSPWSDALTFADRIVSVGALSHGFALEEVTPLFISAWTKLAAEEGLVCTASGVQFSPLPKPAALIVDVCENAPSGHRRA